MNRKQNAMQNRKYQKVVINKQKATFGLFLDNMEKLRALKSQMPPGAFQKLFEMTKNNMKREINE